MTARLMALMLLSVLLEGADVSYAEKIRPLLLAHCASCHRPGEAGPFPLLSYADAKKHSRQIAVVTSSRYMPPWLPEHGYGLFAGEQRLTNGEIELIQKWVEEGAPEGNPEEASSLPRFTEGWQLGKPDLVVTASEPFTVPADGKEVFWNFILTPPVKATRWVKAVEIRPGNQRLVHHANILIDRSGSSRLRESRPGSGFPGMDLTIESDAFDPDSHFLFWKPGSSPQVEPDGMAWRLDPGNALVLNVHLQPSGKTEPLQPSIGLYFTDRPQTKFPMLIQLEHDGALKIAPGDPAFHLADDFTLPIDAWVLAVYPHAHYLGKVLEGYATLPNGKREWLIRIPNWDLNWQAVYRYRTPLFLPKGTVLSMRYTYDNSDRNPRNPSHPPRLVSGGDQSTDEMGHLWLQVLPAGERDLRVDLQVALMKHRLEKYPGDFSAQFNLGALRLGQHDAEGALPWLEGAERARPDEPVALNTLGAALESLGRNQEAIAQFRRAIAAQESYTNARYNLANTLADLGNLDEAIAEFRRVVESSPGDETARQHFEIALEERASQLAGKKDWAAAADRLRELVSLQPGSSKAHDQLANVLVQQGDRAGALEEFRKALVADPADEAARKGIGQLAQ